MSASWPLENLDRNTTRKKLYDILTVRVQITIGNKNFFKPVADYNGGCIRFYNPFNESCNITNIYLVKDLKYNVQSINHVT